MGILGLGGAGIEGMAVPLEGTDAWCDLGVKMHFCLIMRGAHGLRWPQGLVSGRPGSTQRRLSVQQAVRKGAGQRYIGTLGAHCSATSVAASFFAGCSALVLPPANEDGTMHHSGRENNLRFTFILPARMVLDTMFHIMIIKGTGCNRTRYIPGINLSGKVRTVWVITSIPECSQQIPDRAIPWKDTYKRRRATQG